MRAQHRRPGGRSRRAAGGARLRHPRPGEWWWRAGRARPRRRCGAAARGRRSRARAGRGTAGQRRRASPARRALVALAAASASASPVRASREPTSSWKKTPCRPGGADGAAAARAVADVADGGGARAHRRRRPRRRPRRRSAGRRSTPRPAAMRRRAQETSAVAAGHRAGAAPTAPDGRARSPGPAPARRRPAPRRASGMGAAQLGPRAAPPRSCAVVVQHHRALGDRRRDDRDHPARADQPHRTSSPRRRLRFAKERELVTHIASARRLRGGSSS